MSGNLGSFKASPGSALSALPGADGCRFWVSHAHGGDPGMHDAIPWGRRLGTRHPPPLPDTTRCDIASYHLYSNIAPFRPRLARQAEIRPLRSEQMALARTSRRTGTGTEQETGAAGKAPWQRPSMRTYLRVGSRRNPRGISTGTSRCRASPPNGACGACPAGSCRRLAGPLPARKRLRDPPNGACGARGDCGCRRCRFRCRRCGCRRPCSCRRGCSKTSRPRACRACRARSCPSRRCR